MKIFKLKITVNIEWDNTPIFIHKEKRKVINNLANGKKLMAIKIYKDWKKCGLGEAKDMVDYYQVKYQLYKCYEHINDINHYQNRLVDSISKSPYVSKTQIKGLNKTNS